MDPRLEQILSQQQAAGFAGLAGSEMAATIRFSDQLLNQLIAAFLPAQQPLRSVSVRSRSGNRLDVTLRLKTPAFAPPIPIALSVERQPAFPDDPVVVLRVAGLTGGVLHFVGGVLGRFAGLPPGIRLDGERLLVDLRVLAQQRRQAALLAHVQQLTITTEEGRVAAGVVARARPPGDHTI
jgi:hypothetical protein